MIVAEYLCEVCGNTFKVEQGSRRRYCDVCLVEKVIGKKKSRATGMRWQKGCEDRRSNGNKVK